MGRERQDVVRASLLQMFDTVLMVAPAWTIIRNGRYFTGYRKDPRQAVQFLFSALVFGGLAMKWSESLARRCPTGGSITTVSPVPESGPLLLGLEPAILGAMRWAPPPTPAVQATTSTCDAPARPDALLTWLNDMLHRLFPGLPADITFIDLMPYLISITMLLVGVGLHLMLVAGRRVKPTWFTPTSGSSTSRDRMSECSAAVFYAVGLAALCAFAGLFSALHVPHNELGSRLVFVLPVAVAVLLWGLVLAWWLPHWVAAIHGTTAWRLYQINVVIAVPLVPAGLYLAHLLLR